MRWPFPAFLSHRKILFREVLILDALIATHSQECSYLHRLPRPSTILPDAALDIFGREKHSQYRDDMGGVGSFNRQNRTLYVGRIKETRDTAEVVEEHFSEFGEIERSASPSSFPSILPSPCPLLLLLTFLSSIFSPSHPPCSLATPLHLNGKTVKILTARGVAFVTYSSELNAQFAKEAMMHQSLENDEVLNVRYVVPFSRSSLPSPSFASLFFPPT